MHFYGSDAAISFRMREASERESGSVSIMQVLVAKVVQEDFWCVALWTGLQ